MSLVSEYIKLVPRIIKDADKIIESQINLVKMKLGSLPEDEQDEIIKRRIICKTCPFLSTNAAANPAIKYQTDRFDEHCIHCGCNIDRKTAALTEACGINVYNSKHPENQLPLKWEAYKPKTNDTKTN